MNAMLNRFSFVMLSAAVTLAGGCLVHRYGDARLQRNSDALSITADRLYVQPVPLDRRATHVREVRNLPLALYPSHLLIPITPAEAELKANRPWDNAKLRIEFRAPNGPAFFSRELDLASAQPGRSPGTRHQLDVQFRPLPRESWKPDPNLPQHTSYDIVVTVLVPSKNDIHRATLYTDTYVR
jgi:hypothetical protein